MLFSPDFFHTPQVMALSIALLIFLITIFLVVKQWISFSLTLLFLTFALAASLLINYNDSIHCYFDPSCPKSLSESNRDHFEQKMLQAIEDLKTEVKNEKEELDQVLTQINEVLNLLDAQKQKLETFIEETSEHFKSNSPPKEAAQP